MWPFLLFSCLTLLTAAFLCVLRASRISNNLPPGPTGLPIFGNFLSLEKRSHNTFVKWQTKYGDIFPFYMASKCIIIINNFDLARKVFAEELATGRDNSLGLGFFVQKGLLASQGDLWRKHRRFAISTLRDLGMGKSRLEDAVNAEVKELCSILASHNQSPMDPQLTLTHSVSNIICALVFGKRFDHSDVNFTKLIIFIAENMKISAKYGLILQAFPWLKYLPGQFRRGYFKYRDNFLHFSAFVKMLIDEHVDSLSAPGEDARDYVDAFAKEKAKQLTMGKTDHTYDEEQLIISVINLYLGGTDSTAATLLWAIVFMLENPDVKRKVQEEIDNNIEAGKDIVMQDKALLPYTEATILEVQRCQVLSPTGVFRKTLDEMTVQGYMVPKGTLMAPNIYFMHRDPHYWTNPDKFDPGNFLNDKGQVKRPDGFALFSLGKRACFGKPLAKMELYLFFATLMRQFDISLPAGKTVSHDDYDMSFIIAPRPFQVIFTPRH